MKHCETCKHWEQVKPTAAEIKGVGHCLRVVQFWDATEWNRECSSRVLKEQYKDRLSFVEDASDYYASLITMPNFGCVQHKEIEK